MNTPQATQKHLSSNSAVAATQPTAEEMNILEYWDIVVDSRWLIAAIASFAIGAGAVYSLAAKPVYESNLLIQIEDSASSAKSFLGEAASLFDVKTPATAEMEIIRSRMVIGRAVDTTLLYITARPKRIPLIGDWLARRATGLSEPGLFGYGSWVSGKESLHVRIFDVPPSLVNSPFIVIAEGGGRYSIHHEDLSAPLFGNVGEMLSINLPEGQLNLMIEELNALPRAQFELIRASRLTTVEALQQDLKLTEKGRQSGVIDATLRDTDRTRLTTILNAIGQEYVRQNVERKAAEAEKTLAFLEVQLPQFKKQLNQSEEAYNRYRNQKGTVSLEEEARLILAQSVELQAKLFDAQQKRRDLVSRFTAEHPTVKTLDSQIEAWSREVAISNGKIKTLPAVQQDAVRLERDVRVNNELYQQLRNNALQLQLVREGKIGNARLIDSAVFPERPVRPQRSVTLTLAAILGIMGGIIFAIFRASILRGVRSPHEIEVETGLDVFSTVPLSEAQQSIARNVATRKAGQHVLASTAPSDPAVEALRSLRTALNFSMSESANNVLLITSATPGAGKSFISANFAAVLASSDVRVLLIDADLRKGHLNQYFGVERERGLADFLNGSIERAQMFRRDVLHNLDFVPTGTLPPNPAEVLGGSMMSSWVKEVSGQYDLVIVDSAPLLVAADTMSLVSVAGTRLLVARAGQSTTGELRESARQLALSGKMANGVVFNALDLRRRHHGKYKYTQGYYAYANYNYS